MPQGTVITFSRNLGYGFIRVDDGDDQFFRFDSAELPEYQYLNSGDRAWFEKVEGLFGAAAVRVRRICGALCALGED